MMRDRIVDKQFSYYISFFRRWRIMLLPVFIAIFLVVCEMPVVAAAGTGESEKLEQKTLDYEGDGIGGLRDIVVKQAWNISNVPWTLEKRIKKADPTGERLAAFIDGGILPQTYFEFSRLQFNNRGVMMDANCASYELFTTMIDNNKENMPGIGHIDSRESYYGMDVDAFLTDVVSRVSAQKVTGVKEALSSSAFKPLLEVSDLSFDQTSSVKAMSTGEITYETAKIAYEKLQKGDILLAYDDNASGGNTAISALEKSAPEIHAMIVGAVDKSQETVSVYYPGYSLPTYFFKCDSCGQIEIEGPTSAALPIHVTSTTSSTFASFKTHMDTDSSSQCIGTWQPLYASTWRHETVSYAQLFGEEGEKVPYGSMGYIPFTLAAYTEQNAQSVSFDIQNVSTADDIMSGFSAEIISNYRIISIDAVLKNINEGTEKHFKNYADWDSWNYRYQNEELDRVLADADAGEYMITLYAQSGKISDIGTMEIETPKKIYEIAFSLESHSFDVSAERNTVHQGESVAVKILPCTDGYIEAEVSFEYDSKYFQFDMIDSEKINVGVNFIDDKKGTLLIHYSGDALDTKDLMAELIFTAIRSGKNSIDSREITPFSILAAKARSSETPVLVPVRGGNQKINIGVGFNATVQKGYVESLGECYDLILIHANTPANFTYDGTSMFKILDTRYQADGKGYAHIYGYIAVNANMDLVSIGTSTPVGLTYCNDVNQSGWTDLNDAATVSNICAGALPLKGNIAKWLLADVNQDGFVNDQDIDILWATLLK